MRPPRVGSPPLLGVSELRVPEVWARALGRRERLSSDARLAARGENGPDRHV